MARTLLGIILAAPLALAACGDTVGEQAISGAVIGAGTSAIFNGDVGTGAVVGAVGGLVYCRAFDADC
ncbi:hypothetical protein [Tateyamaria sp. SN6-1]|uniref:hypothetical protein n=1 Tax=Tateyamaria sp. SN6-1 TaxID=3092148 RepID=UPI0039F4D988